MGKAIAQEQQNTQDDKVLVGIMPRLLDWTIAREKLWYRIPVTSVEKLLKKRFPPKWLAFYKTKVFGADAFAISDYAHIVQTRRVLRQELFPEDSGTAKGATEYYQLQFETALVHESAFCRFCPFFFKIIGCSWGR